MKNYLRFAITLLLLISLLSACQSGAPAPDPTTTPQPPATLAPTHTSTATATITQTLEPASPTPPQAPPPLGNNLHPPLADAPGKYVLERS